MYMLLVTKYCNVSYTGHAPSSDMKHWKVVIQQESYVMCVCMCSCLCCFVAVLSSSILYTCGRFGILVAYSEFQSLYLLIRMKISGYVLLPKNLFYLRLFCLQQQIFTTLLSPSIHSFSLLFSISESHESRLEETEVETKGSLGKRLWKRIKKQQLYSHDRVLTSEWKAVMLDQKTMTKKRVGRLEKEKEVPETRAEEAERREPKCVQV